jgi:hypothetical protein
MMAEHRFVVVKKTGNFYWTQLSDKSIGGMQQFRLQMIDHFVNSLATMKYPMMQQVANLLTIKY